MNNLTIVHQYPITKWSRILVGWTDEAVRRRNRKTGDSQRG
ncbi:hypothetical protein [Paenibacillus sp. BJ-4]|nr:hypothetical protein [Paenibacillus sp. BJ-4]